MHKLSLGGLLLSLIVLSGCSLTPPKIGGGGNTSDTTRDPFQSKAIPGSLWRSTDGGKTFEPKVTVDDKRKITSANVLDISFLLRDSSGNLDIKRAPSVFIGTVDNGIFKSNDSGEQWEPRTFPPKKVYRFTADVTNPDRMFATGVIANFGKVFRTKDGGETWQDVYTEPGAGTVIVSLAQSRWNPETLFIGTSAGTIVRSNDGGDTWKNVGSGIDGPITEIVFDASVQTRVYALVYEKKVYRSDDSGLTWVDPLVEATKGTTATAARVSGQVSLVADPYHSGRLYMGTKKGLYRSLDTGINWEKVNIIESAEKFPIRAIAVNPKNSNEISFVSGHTFYKSTNSGDTWSVVPLDVDREVSVLAYDPFDPNVLYLGLRKF